MNPKAYRRVTNSPNDTKYERQDALMYVIYIYRICSSCLIAVPWYDVGDVVLSATFAV